jgi:hypothetical protein
VWRSDAGWCKLDDREWDATTNHLVLAAQAKKENALVKVREEMLAEGREVRREHFDIGEFPTVNDLLHDFIVKDEVMPVNGGQDSETGGRDNPGGSHSLK